MIGPGSDKKKDRMTERSCLFFPFKRAFIAFMVVLMMEANHFWDNPWHRSLELPRSSYFSLTQWLHHHLPSKVFLQPFVSQRNAKVPKSCKTALHHQSWGCERQTKPRIFGIRRYRRDWNTDVCLDVKVTLTRWGKSGKMGAHLFSLELVQG